jgi:uncharacterized RDD family membrane protein YckC
MEEELELRPARFNDRLIAYVIDAAPFMLGFLATLYFGVVKKGIFPDAVETVQKVGGAWLGLFLLYQVAGNALGATIGKKLMGLRVVRKDGQPLGLVRSVLRAGGYLLSQPFFNWGFLVALAHPETRAFHDLISGSLVVEPRPKNAAESTLLFVAAVMALSAMYGGTIFLFFNAPTPSDRLAVEKARDGLQIMAQIEEAYRATSDRYTSNLQDLAVASGDPESFRASMGVIFDPNRFRLEAGNKAYRISAFARDRRATKVVIEGPPARIVE